jgi:chaperone protein htpG
MKKQFKAESKKLLDLMIHSIYTNKEIFLRELISNASDAIDKLYYLSLTDKKLKVKKEDLKINLAFDKENRTITITDNGIGMNKAELEKNLGTIAESGSLLFKTENEHKKDIDVIGQFGVGFYSAFMVSKEVEVISKKYDEDKFHLWKSSGTSGYSIDDIDTDGDFSTKIVLYLKDDTDEENYSEYLEQYKLQTIVKKYSNYITYPIVMNVTKSVLKEGSKDEYEDKTTEETLNSMIPIWKKNRKDVSDEDYNNFYKDSYHDYDDPSLIITSSVEGRCSYKSLMFIPSHTSYDMYTKEFKKGLSLYSNGVLIMDKCEDLLPDYFSFVKGLVDSEDISLNISREILQQNHQVELIAKSIETKIKKELETMLRDDREKYDNFFKNFGMQLKFGIYNDYGMHKDVLKDLIMFYSSTEKKLVTLSEYVSRMKDGQDKIFYACGESVDKIDLLPQVENVKDKGYEVLYLTEYVDEFAIQMLMDYEGKKFANVSSEALDLDTEDEKKELEEKNSSNKEMFDEMTSLLDNEIKEVRFTNKLKNHPVCLTSKGNVSIEMEKVMNSMPTGEKVNAEKVLEINENHPIVSKLEDLYKNNKEEFDNYTRILYQQARLIEGLPVDNPTELTNLICNVISK